MNQLIQQAAEELHSNGNKLDIYNYVTSVRHFILKLNSEGYKFLKLEDLSNPKTPDEILFDYAINTDEIEGDQFISCLLAAMERYAEQAYLIGSSLEQERMKGVMEKASEAGWYYANGWRDRNEPFETRIENTKTTDELIKQYENKEG